MRRNLKRYYGAGDLHFITCSCYRRQPLLATPRRRGMFLTVLERMRERYQFVAVSYTHLDVYKRQDERDSCTK